MAKQAKTTGTKGNAPVADSGNLKQFATRIPAELHSAMKVHCAQTGQKVETFAADCLRNGLANAGSKRKAA